jgi:hypothetical protein
MILLLLVFTVLFNIVTSAVVSFDVKTGLHKSWRSSLGN